VAKDRHIAIFVEGSLPRHACHAEKIGEARTLLRCGPAERASPEIAARCVRIVKDLRLVFGCIDLIVRPDGETVFLEVNESGQFLFLEHFAEVPLLDLFSEFLMSGNPDFLSAAGGEQPVQYGDVEAAVEAMAEEAR
jgi:glutathione synthase/RimK-type ligase-like ATP-grasp enzyme